MQRGKFSLLVTMNTLAILSVLASSNLQWAVGNLLEQPGIDSSYYSSSFYPQPYAPPPIAYPPYQPPQYFPPPPPEPVCVQNPCPCIQNPCPPPPCPREPVPETCRTYTISSCPSVFPQASSGSESNTLKDPPVETASNTIEEPTPSEEPTPPRVSSAPIFSPPTGFSPYQGYNPNFGGGGLGFHGQYGYTSMNVGPHPKMISALRSLDDGE